MSDLLTWAARYHYPQLVLSREDIIRHGEATWRAFVASRNVTRAILAQERVAKWQRRVDEYGSWTCGNCGTENPGSARSCYSCGKPR